MFRRKGKRSPQTYSIYFILCHNLPCPPTQRPAIGFNLGVPEEGWKGKIRSGKEKQNIFDKKLDWVDKCLTMGLQIFKKKSKRQKTHLWLHFQNFPIFVV